ncbi:hypothetical protein Cgig2_005917 [Carnegiea gigantea]|uniref:Uncharacterized protein n=1 Tax=Carnegiea gigantea TaxID=171969 RepID=A0A9Q1JW40_9CARY|nr:hypothetical protein Cgig2_005917 [Carnegiea gigantea]
MKYERSFDLRGTDGPTRETMTTQLDKMANRSSRLGRPSSQPRSTPRGSAREPLGGGAALSVLRLGNTYAVYQYEGHPMLKKLQPMTALSRPHNARKCRGFHEQNDHTTAELRELKKALNKLVDKGQIDPFLKTGPHSFHKDRDLACKEPQEEECSTEIMATIAGGYA